MAMLAAVSALLRGLRSTCAGINDRHRSKCASGRRGRASLNGPWNHLIRNASVGFCRTARREGT